MNNANKTTITMFWVKVQDIKGGDFHSFMGFTCLDLAQRCSAEIYARSGKLTMIERVVC